MVKRLRRSDIEETVPARVRRTPDEPRASPRDGFSCFGASRGCFYRSCQEPFSYSQGWLELSSPCAWLRRALENCRVWPLYENAFLVGLGCGEADLGTIRAIRGRHSELESTRMALPKRSIRGQG